MPVRKLIENASFAPEALEVLYAAFDLAWEEVASHVGPDPTAITFARERLAQAVLSAARLNATDPTQIKTDAVAAFLSSDPTER
ncbi:hypothetical protein [Hyphomicrobium sp. LHD-15]|uniref:hypothetical protein n=1 Tax=Hyphomicrobium sp. LHD-15 TaxID=3072142 RepID=UPI00280CB7BE|nr:hypothetical protein [Hyphomicrobium sp. LHD-15]MDQ8698420.1 hypothetical protein [Hyphomicrobium sp. LHD-15]